MALPALKPLPPPIFVAIRPEGTHTQAWADYFAAVDNLLRTVATVALAAPTNANAAAAGVPLGGLYTDQADPARVFIRTV